jgi:two-component system, OmpR family, alkaline phosphatase synthesis response regulator PhoP
MSKSYTLLKNKNKDKDKVRVLVVDDEEDILEMLQYNLEKEGYDVQTAENGKQAIEKAQKFAPQIILMDIMMPVMDGIDACRQMRSMAEFNKAFILVLTARTEEYSEIAAFDAGADDFISKPIKPKALLSRISAFLRREKKGKDESKVLIEVGDLSIDRNTYQVLKEKVEIKLPRKEFELLFFLAAHPGKVFGRDELLQKVWGTDVYVLSRTVDVHVRKVRERIGDDYISTIKGVGYIFDYEDGSESKK